MDRNDISTKREARIIALRKESVDRNLPIWTLTHAQDIVARKESVDRKLKIGLMLAFSRVALRKESVIEIRLADMSTC